jgi:hypothetical protein
LNHFIKPTNLFGFFIDCLSLPGDTILEYCAGTATGLIAALERNRNYIGFDTNQTQFNGASIRAQKFIEKLKSVKDEESDEEEEEDENSNEEDEEIKVSSKICLSCGKKKDLTKMENCLNL